MAIIFSTPLYSAEEQPQYDPSKSLGPKIALSGVALAGISDELAEILNDLGAGVGMEVEEKRDILLIMSSIRTFRIICRYESEILMAHIKYTIESKDIEYLGFRIDRIKDAKSEMEKDIKIVKKFYFLISNKAALHLIDKAKETMYSALSLIEADIEALGALRNYLN